MKIIALEKELSSSWPEEPQELLKAEAAAVWKYYQEGVIREIYFRNDIHCAVILLECPDEAVAGELLARLPLVQAGLIEFELIPLAPYTGFERLFARA